MMKQKKLKVGFDFDGVLYYNPARIVRLPIKLLKEHFLPKRQLKFWKPQTAWQKELWLLAHKTSLFPAAGYKHLLQLLEEKQFHGYIITGRYGYLKPEFEQRLNKCDPHNLFQGYYLNEKSMQPHKFKEQTIKKLELDYYIEDNWDIVNYLSKSNAIKNCQIHWIYNILDRKTKYPHKHASLNSFINELALYEDLS